MKVLLVLMVVLPLCAYIEASASAAVTAIAVKFVKDRVIDYLEKEYPGLDVENFREQAIEHIKDTGRVLIPEILKGNGKEAFIEHVKAHKDELDALRQKLRGHIAYAKEKFNDIKGTIGGFINIFKDTNVILLIVSEKLRNMRGQVIDHVLATGEALAPSLLSGDFSEVVDHIEAHKAGWNVLRAKIIGHIKAAGDKFNDLKDKYGVAA